jgi:ribosomal protein L11 methyltransferase
MPARADGLAAVVTTMVLVVPVSDIERASDVIWTHGAYGFEERRHSDGRAALVLAPDPALARALIDADGTGEWVVHHEQISTDTLHAWRHWATPIRIDDSLVVEPSWFDAAAKSQSPGETGLQRILIDPEASFGLGDRPTTLLCARAVRHLLSRAPARGASLLDVGCGSGLLSIIAATSGAGTVTAIDISAAAVETTLRNATRNDVSVNASTTPLSGISGSFDIVVANLLAPIIDELAIDLRRVVAPGGVLVVSGLLESQLDAARRRVSADDILVEIVTSLERGWGAITFEKPPDSAPT